jgi:hypothetical protein
LILGIRCEYKHKILNRLIFAMQTWCVLRKSRNSKCHLDEIQLPNVGTVASRIFREYDIVTSPVEFGIKNHLAGEDPTAIYWSGSD